MKTKQLLCSIALLLLPFVICSASQERSLTKILQELRIELQTSYIQRSEAQKALNEDYERQQQPFHINKVPGYSQTGSRSP